MESQNKWKNNSFLCTRDGKCNCITLINIQNFENYSQDYEL